MAFRLLEDMSAWAIWQYRAQDETMSGMPPALACTECERLSGENARGWEGYLVDQDGDGKDEVVFYCPACAAKEFHWRPEPSEPSEG
jgi:hypothetical protein